VRRAAAAEGAHCARLHCLGTASACARVTPAAAAVAEAAAAAPWHGGRASSSHNGRYTCAALAQRGCSTCTPLLRATCTSHCASTGLAAPPLHGACEWPRQPLLLLRCYPARALLLDNPPTSEVVPWCALSVEAPSMEVTSDGRPPRPSCDCCCCCCCCCCDNCVVPGWCEVQPGHYGRQNMLPTQQCHVLVTSTAALCKAPCNGAARSSLGQQRGVAYEISRFTISRLPPTYKGSGSGSSSSSGDPSSKDV
jgi:hypothetical protein